MLSRVGTLIGKYVIEHKLGEGGTGTVHLARSRGGRAVAVKVARPELASDPSFRARFRAEVAAARQVGGFRTAQVVDEWVRQLDAVLRRYLTDWGTGVRERRSAAGGAAALRLSGSATAGRARAGPPRSTRRCRPSRPSWSTRSWRRAATARSVRA